ncbi:MAG: hypothetical protein ABI345_07215, partial [Jatrophihabitans sp.]
MRIALSVLVLVLLVGVAPVLDAGAGAAPAQHSTSTVWPSQGQAAYALGAPATVRSSPHAHKAPIASMAKVMTAYAVLWRFPLAIGANGFTMVVTQLDVNDRAWRVSRGESTVPVARGERLTERQALAALLLPSANNVAIMLARRVSGSVTKFVALMNSTARSLHMRQTTYTDPSGFEASTQSTPGDQVLLAQATIWINFIRIMAQQSSYWIPVAGRVYNTDTLLRHAGFVGIKTGSMSQSGGCFMFRTRRVIAGKVVSVYGVVMGQTGPYGYLQAGLDASRRLADRVA